MNDERFDNEESGAQYVPPAFRPRHEHPPQGMAPPPPAPSSPLSRIEFERLFGGRVLAWIGALATLLGLVFLLRSAVDSSWFTEEVRTLMAGLGSLLLLGLGLWLHERKGQLEAARVAVAIAIPGLYATTVVASQVYDLISPVIGLEAAALIGVLGVFIAVRWSSMLVASVGVLGALAAPMLVGTETDGGSIAFVALALAASVGVLLWQRWNWLALGAFAISAPQLISWIYEEGFIVFEGTADPSQPVLLVLAVLVGFWALYAAAAFGYELRSRAEGKLPISSWLLLLSSSVLVVGAGCVVIGGDSNLALDAWIFGFAIAHLLLGGAAIRFGVHREIGSLLIGGGIGLATFGLANAFDGPTLVAAWSAAAAALAYLATRVDRGPAPALADAERLLIAAFGFLGLAIVHMLVVEAPPFAIAEGVDDLLSSMVAIACCAGAAAACWHWGREIEPGTATVAGFVAATGFVYLGSILIIDVIGDNASGEAREIGQAWLSAFWTATGLGAVVWGMVRRSPKARLGGLALLAIAIAKVWTYDLSELEETARALSFVALGLLLLAGAFAYQRFLPKEEEEELAGADEREPQASV
ncbi:MAG TPA: DUF2339 domain-containing protein [Solirubrobacterales bacterium]|nr:DUF2339 domain-containing protein [Solirubrobacterales bacterium]